MILNKPKFRNLILINFCDSCNVEIPSCYSMHLLTISDVLTLLQGIRKMSMRCGLGFEKVRVFKIVRQWAGVIIPLNHVWVFRLDVSFFLFQKCFCPVFFFSWTISGTHRPRQVENTHKKKTVNNIEGGEYFVKFSTISSKIRSH